MIKYRCEYYSEEEDKWRVDVETDSYTGDPISVDGIENRACIFTYTNQDDPYAVIIPCSVAIGLYSDGQIDVEELQLANDRDFKVNVYCNDQLKFTGFVVPDRIQKVLQSPPFEVTFTAIDGLSLLDGIDFKGLRGDPMGEGISNLSPLAFIREVLFHNQYLGLRLPITWASSVICTAYPSDVYGALAGTPQWGDRGRAYRNYNTSSDGEVVYKKCSYVLENMLKAFQCRIFQSNGKWNIRRINDIVTGSFTVHEIDTTFDQGGAIPNITTYNIDSNRAINPTGDYHFLNENQSSMMMAALKSLTATYRQNQPSNVLPNGSFNDSILGGFITDWGFLPNIDGVQFYAGTDLTQRSGNSAMVDFPSGAPGTGDEGYLTMWDTEELGLPMDATLLFKQMRLGFTFMAERYPTQSDGQTVDWTDNPLQISVKYTTRLDDGFREYYLNEFGYWQYEARGIDLGTTFNYQTSESVGGPNPYNDNRMYFTGAPNIGDTIAISIIRNRYGDVRDTYTATCEAAEEGNLELFLIKMRDALPASTGGWDLFNKQVVMQDVNNGYIRYSIVVGYGQPEITTYKGTLQDFKRINIRVDQVKLWDVAKVAFQSKGNSGDILMPDPKIIDSQPEDIIGRLQVMLYVKRGQKIFFDDVYVNVEDNNDVYRSENPSSSNTKTDSVDLEISSSFSGFMVSNIMTSWTNSSEEYIFTDGKYTGSLTGMTANAMMRFRYKPSVIFEGTVYGKNWSYDEIYSIESFENRKFIPLKATYNTENCELDLVSCECRDDTPTLSQTHYASNDKQLSN